MTPNDSSVVVVGHGPIASGVARRLGHPVACGVVRVLAQDDSFEESVEPESLAIVRGVPYSPETLRRAGVDADTFVLALTDTEEVNFVIAVVARRVLGVTRVLACVEATRHRELWEELHVSTVDPAELATEVVLAAVRRPSLAPEVP